MDVEDVCGQWRYSVVLGCREVAFHMEGAVVEGQQREK